MPKYSYLNNCFIIISSKIWEDFTLARPFIDKQFISLFTTAFKTAHCVPADVVTATIVQSTFIYICNKEEKQHNKTCLGTKKGDNRMNAI